MKRATLAIAIAVMTLCSAMRLSATVEQDVLNANDQTNAALVSRNVPQLQNLLAPSFLSNGGAVSINKGEILNGLLSGTMTFQQVIATNRVVSLNADGTATLTGTKTQIGTYNGIDISGTYQFVTRYGSTGPGGWVALSTICLPCQ